MSDDLELPNSERLDRLGVTLGDELHAGHQSRVVTGRVEGVAAAVKFTDARLSDGAALTARMSVVERLGSTVSEVVMPLRIGGALVHPLDGWFISATPWIHGAPPDSARPSDAGEMGRALARLHVALADVPPSPIPAVAALREATDDLAVSDRSGWQLIHGDFSDKNVLVSSEGLTVLDFDDCGYGPVAYDLANSIYMVLFDAETSGRPERCEEFRRPFLAGYDAAGGVVDVDGIEAMIAVRIEALSRWLDDLTTAPIGIRTSSHEWRDVLRDFVASHLEE